MFNFIFMKDNKLRVRRWHEQGPMCSLFRRRDPEDPQESAQQKATGADPSADAKTEIETGTTPDARSAKSPPSGSGVPTAEDKLALAVLRDLAELHEYASPTDHESKQGSNDGQGRLEKSVGDLGYHSDEDSDVAGGRITCRRIDERHPRLEENKGSRGGPHAKSL